MRCTIYRKFFGEKRKKKTTIETRRKPDGLIYRFDEMLHRFKNTLVQRFTGRTPIENTILANGFDAKNQI